MEYINREDGDFVNRTSTFVALYAIIIESLTSNTVPNKSSESSKGVFLFSTLAVTSARYKTFPSFSTLIMLSFSITPRTNISKVSGTTEIAS